MRSNATEPLIHGKDRKNNESRVKYWFSADKIDGGKMRGERESLGF